MESKPKNAVTTFRLRQVLAKLTKPAKGKTEPGPIKLRDAAVIELMAYGGLMPAEIVRLKRNQVQADTLSLVVVSDRRMVCAARFPRFKAASSFWDYYMESPGDFTLPVFRGSRGNALTTRTINNIVRDAFLGKVNPMALRAYYRSNHQDGA